MSFGKDSIDGNLMAMPSFILKAIHIVFLVIQNRLIRIRFLLERNSIQTISVFRLFHKISIFQIIVCLFLFLFRSFINTITVVLHFLMNCFQVLKLLIINMIVRIDTLIELLYLLF